MDILSARLAELVVQLHGLRDQLRAAVFQTVREAVSRSAGDAVDRLWNPNRRRFARSDYEDEEHWRRSDDDDDERPWPSQRPPQTASAKRSETLGRVIRAGLGWWLLRRHSFLAVIAIGSAGLAIAIILGPERVTPSKILELVIPALEILTSQ